MSGYFHCSKNSSLCLQGKWQSLPKSLPFLPKVFTGNKWYESTNGESFFANVCQFIAKACDIKVGSLASCHRINKLNFMLVSAFQPKDSCNWLTFGLIMLPVEHDLRSSPVARGNIARHLISSNSGQTEIKDLRN